MQEEKETKVKDPDDLMSFDGFCSCVRMDIQRRLGRNFHVSLNVVPKNNGVTLKGLTVREKSENVAPNIYLERFYRMYGDGCPLDEIEDEILLLYMEHRKEAKFDTSCFADWQKAKGNIVYKLVNADRNRELLLNAPHRRFLDLAILYEYNAAMGNGSGRILIRNEHMAAWGVSEEMLHETAMANAPKLLGWQLRSMSDVLAEMITGQKAEAKEMEIPEKPPRAEADIPLFVLANRKSFNGAGCILYPSLLTKVAEKWECDICIIPSSIHEILLIPMDMVKERGSLSPMVREVNESQLAPEEVLADHAYLYSRETGKITSMSEDEEKTKQESKSKKVKARK